MKTPFKIPCKTDPVNDQAAHITDPAQSKTDPVNDQVAHITDPAQSKTDQVQSKTDQVYDQATKKYDQVQSKTDQVNDQATKNTTKLTQTINLRNDQVPQNMTKLKLSKKQLDIRNYCSIPRTGKEILQRVGVTDHFDSRKRYIYDLVEAGVLERIIPDKPNDPNQKYRKKDTDHGAEFKKIRNSTAEFLIFQIEGKEDGVRVVCRDETVWCTQKAMTQLFDVGVPAISKHLKTRVRDKNGA